tara:strand:+ start:365 stop:808 length:444 start_codon:yes stop_codon:yes gene_type:complete
LFKQLFKKKRRRSSKRKNNRFRKTNASKVVAIRSKKHVSRANYYTYPQKYNIYPSIIIFFGFISLSLTIFLFTKQIQPFLDNERLKILCTYQIGDKKNRSYKESKIKLDKIVGDGDKFCKNFIFPKEKSKRGSRFMPILKNVIFRFI